MRYQQRWSTRHPRAQRISGMSNTFLICNVLEFSLANLLQIPSARPGSRRNQVHPPQSQQKYAPSYPIFTIQFPSRIPAWHASNRRRGYRGRVSIPPYRIYKAGPGRDDLDCFEAVWVCGRFEVNRRMAGAQVSCIFSILCFGLNFTLRFDVPHDCSVELSPQGYQFFTDIFQIFDKVCTRKVALHSQWV
jgi:hypothetical protein